LTPTAFLTTLITLLITAGALVVNGSAMFSPGALNAQSSGILLGGVYSHAELGSDCAACHASFLSAAKMSDRCLDCHSDIMNQSKDFHIIMFAQSQQHPCQDCHTDHHGAEATLTNQKMINFPHDQLGFSLKRHLKTASGAAFTCADCHLLTFTRPEESLCVVCHNSYQADFMQKHQIAFTGDCLSCHDGIDRFTSFDHGKTPFILSGKHQQVLCQDCHRAAHAIADLQGLPQDCKSCHAAKDPHAGQFAADCSACHNTQAWTPPPSTITR